jgi:uncharacterized protein YprB with RNaseH-like and TPR domain
MAPTGDRDLIRRAMLRTHGAEQPESDAATSEPEPASPRKATPAASPYFAWNPELGEPRQPMAQGRRYEHPTRSITLDDAVRGVELQHAKWGPSFVRCDVAADLGRTATSIETLVRSAFGDPGSTSSRATAGPTGRPAQRAIFLDIETTGLGNSPVFLVGMLEYDQGVLTLNQHLARDYSEEPAVVAWSVEALAGADAVLTFNGKSFDVPYLRARAAATGVLWTPPAAHVDLLHMARRCWADALPDCKLQTLERQVCGRRRAEDIPGWAVPDAYHHFVRTGNATHLERILEHNLQDLLTLAELAARLP